MALPISPTILLPPPPHTSREDNFSGNLTSLEIKEKYFWNILRSKGSFRNEHTVYNVREEEGE